MRPPWDLDWLIIKLLEKFILMGYQVWLRVHLWSIMFRSLQSIVMSSVVHEVPCYSRKFPVFHRIWPNIMKTKIPVILGGCYMSGCLWMLGSHDQRGGCSRRIVLVKHFLWSCTCGLLFCSARFNAADRSPVFPLIAISNKEAIIGVSGGHLKLLPFHTESSRLYWTLLCGVIGQMWILDSPRLNTCSLSPGKGL